MTTNEGAPLLESGQEAPRRKTYTAAHIALVPLDLDRDMPDLFEGSHGSPDHEAIWDWMPAGPFRDEEQMRVYYRAVAASDDPLFLTVIDRETDRRVGIASFMSIDAASRRLEVGHIWYSPSHQRGRANNEVMLLMLGEAFDHLGCRRVEWKCDAQNERSRRAALRLGFSFEGIFRQHLIVKGKNRDTAWFSMLDHEWADAQVRLVEASGA